MATKGDIKQAVYDECRVVLASLASVSVPHGQSFTALDDTDAHLGVSGQRDDGVYPYVAFEEFSSTLSRGVGDYVYVDDVAYVGGSVDSITFRKDEAVQYDLYVQTTSEGRKDALYEALKRHFEQYLELKTPSDIHPHIDSFDITDTSDSDRRADGVRGDRLRIEMEYRRLETYTDIPTIETVEMNFDIEDEGDIAEKQYVVQN